MTKLEAIDALIKTATNEVGYLEKSKAAYRAHGVDALYPLTTYAGSDNYTKYGYEMHKVYPSVMDFPAAWCDAFVDWCFYKTFGTATAKSLLHGNFDDYTVASAEMYKKHGAYHKGTDGIERGDQIFFRNSSRICHTGIVKKVENGIIFTVEGNTSPQEKEANVVSNGGGVFEKQYPLGYSRIDGYGRPAWEKIASEEIAPLYPRWICSDGVWYYRIGKYENAHGWRVINHHWYYFDDTGAMSTGLDEIESEKYGTELYYFEEDGDLEGALYHSDDRGALKIWEVD